MKIKHVAKGPVRVGVVGCGVVAGYGHIPAIDRMDNAELVAFADPDKTHRETQGEKYNKPAFASFEEMAASVELDAVSIPTHPKIKLDLVRIAAANGLHVFSEKPLTDTVEQAEELVRIMDEAGLFVATAFIYRGKPAVQRMMELLREGRIGRLRAVHIENMWDYHGHRSDSWGPDYKGRRHRALKNMGTLDCGVHDLDLARYMAGSEYTDISAIGTVVEAANEYPDHIIMHSRMENGVLVTVEESGVWGYTAKETPHYQQSYRMVGEKGVISITHPADSDDVNAATIEVVAGEESFTESSSIGKAWDATYHQFFQIILGEEPEHRIVATGHDALVNMRVAREVISQCQAKDSQ